MKAKAPMPAEPDVMAKQDTEVLPGPDTVMADQEALARAKYGNLTKNPAARVGKRVRETIALTLCGSSRSFAGKDQTVRFCRLDDGEEPGWWATTVTTAAHTARSHLHIVCTKSLLLGSAEAHPTAMPPVMVMDKIEKIEAELASIHAMLKQLTCTQQRKEGRRFDIVNVRGVEHIFAPWGTTIRIAKGDEAKTQAHMK